MTNKAWMAAAAAAFLTATLTAAAETGTPPRGDERSGRTDYRIGPEDVLEISVWKNEAMSQTVPVRPDGKISLPLLNDVQAAGMTPMELKESLAKMLSEYMPNPEVSVIVREVRSFKVSVIGEVAHPGRYELKSRTTVLDVLAQAGGFTEFAARSRIVILRGGDKRVEKIRFNFNKAVNDGAVGNVDLRPGDIVLVP
ncbi:MAG TPA: polysaccharide biosynthesis/export family protein [Candidatus Polarisedimenticolia bacterium]|nr:polysaccharide biosynthesis/export family protein [Candidatus Polarisedimenticolia bacterium]